MSYPVVHLYLAPPPEPTFARVIDYACGFASHLGARIEATSCHLVAGASPTRAGGGLLASLARQGEEAAADVSAALESHLEEKSLELGLNVSKTVVEAAWPSAPPDFSWRGRTSELCVLQAPTGPVSRATAEGWVLGSGRPCLLLPPDAPQMAPPRSILICWDMSRDATRAVFDALPLLRRAERVKIVTFSEHERLAHKHPARLLGECLAERGVESQAEEVDRGPTGVGSSIIDHAAAFSADLIVMGAYGHGRIQELILGGATRHVLSNLSVPVLMSH